MLYERLNAMSTDPEDPESMAELVVAALGTSGRHYICWKTRSGRYRQDSYGLPPALQQWLFPENGCTRDFSTLQVILGRGDEFFASDCNGKVENKKAPEPTPEKPARSEEPAPKRLDRRRSRTLSFVGPSPNGRGGWQAGDFSSRPPYLPIALRQEMAIKRRPRSIALGENEQLPDLQPRPRSVPEVSGICHCGCHKQEAQQPQRPPEKEKPKYVSTGIQTDPPPPPPTPPEPEQVRGLEQTPRRKRSFGSASVSSSSGSSTPSSRSSRSRRSSTATDITAPSTYGSPSHNPVMMGKMQDYFRSSGYQLGDALRPAYREMVPVDLYQDWSDVLDRRSVV